MRLFLTRLTRRGPLLRPSIHRSLSTACPHTVLCSNCPNTQKILELTGSGQTDSDIVVQKPSLQAENCHLQDELSISAQMSSVHSKRASTSKLTEVYFLSWLKYFQSKTLTRLFSSMCLSPKQELSKQLRFWKSVDKHAKKVEGHLQDKARSRGTWANSTKLNSLCSWANSASPAVQPRSALH